MAKATNGAIDWLRHSLTLPVTDWSFSDEPQNLLFSQLGLICWLARASLDSFTNLTNVFQEGALGRRLICLNCFFSLVVSARVAMLTWAHRIAHLCDCHRLSAIPLLNLLFYVQAQLLAGLCHGLQRSGGLQRLLATASLFTASSCFLRFLLYIVKRLRGHLLNNFLLFVLVCWTLSKSQVE